jgi:hypothetical protein
VTISTPSANPYPRDGFGRHMPKIAAALPDVKDGDLLEEDEFDAVL